VTALRWATFAAAGYSAVSLLWLVLKTRRRNRPAAVFAAPLGSARRGIAYALGAGLLPWAKESTRLHRAAYLAGIVYHAGIFAGVASTAFLLLDFHLSAGVWSALRLVMSLGLACGLGLLAKRIARPIARTLSHPDDYAANALVDLFVAAAVAATRLPAARPLLYCVSIALALYLPVGKLRHCVFFFYSRILFGRSFGRRGVLPPAHHRIHP
jgi:hypothetical protein